MTTLQIPLLNVDNQSLTVFLKNGQGLRSDYKMQVRYQPSDDLYYFSMSNGGNRLISGRRLTTDRPVLPADYGFIQGSIWCQSTSSYSSTFDPGRGAWGNRTHRLVWTDDAIETNMKFKKSEPDERARVLDVLKALR